MRAVYRLTIIHYVHISAEGSTCNAKWPCNPKDRSVYIFPEDQHPLVVSYGSGFGGNAMPTKLLLGGWLLLEYLSRHAWPVVQLALYLYITTFTVQTGQRFCVSVV